MRPIGLLVHDEGIAKLGGAIAERFDTPALARELDMNVNGRTLLMGGGASSIFDPVPLPSR